jgi:hypothetical protein
MAGNGNIRRLIILENVVENSLAPDVLIGRRFSLQRHPVWVFLRKTLLELELGKVLLDIALRATTIACMCADAFAQEFLDNWLEFGMTMQLQALKSEPGGVEAPIQRGCIVTLRCGDLLVFEEMCPEGVDLICLRYTGWRKMCIGPRDRTVSIAFGPVAIPSRSTKVRFRRIVIALSVSAHEQQTISLILGRSLVQRRDVVSQALPLGALLVRRAARVRWVGPIDEPEVAGDEVE